MQKSKPIFSIGQQVQALVANKPVYGSIKALYQHDYTREDTIFVMIETEDQDRIYAHPNLLRPQPNLGDLA